MHSLFRCCRKWWESLTAWVGDVLWLLSNYFTQKNTESTQHTQHIQHVTNLSYWTLLISKNRNAIETPWLRVHSKLETYRRFLPKVHGVYGWPLRINIQHFSHPEIVCFDHESHLTFILLLGPKCPFKPKFKIWLQFSSLP